MCTLMLFITIIHKKEDISDHMCILMYLIMYNHTQKENVSGHVYALLDGINRKRKRPSFISTTQRLEQCLNTLVQIRE